LLHPQTYWTSIASLPPRPYKIKKDRTSAYIADPKNARPDVHFFVALQTTTSLQYLYRFLRLTHTACGKGSVFTFGAISGIFAHLKDLGASEHIPRFPQHAHVCVEMTGFLCVRPCLWPVLCTDARFVPQHAQDISRCTHPRRRRVQGRRGNDDDPVFGQAGFCHERQDFQDRQSGRTLRLSYAPRGQLDSCVFLLPVAIDGCGGLSAQYGG